MNPPPPNGKKNTAKTKIFACLCPCSVFEYVDTDNKKKENDVGKCMDPMDQNQKPTKDVSGKLPQGMPGSYGQSPFGARSPCTDASKPRGGILSQKGQSRGFIGQSSLKGPCKMQNAGDSSLLKKPLKIVVEEVDCSKMDFSHCNKPCCPPPCPPPRNSCAPNSHTPQHSSGCSNDNIQHQGSQSHRMSRASQASQMSTSQQNRQQQGNQCNRACCQPPPCPPPPCPPPCPPPPCPDMCGEQPQKDCCPPPPCPEVTRRFEMKLDKSGKLMNQCTPAGAPTILKVEKDESCSNETIIKITYCATGTESGAKKGEDQQEKGDKKSEKRNSQEHRDSHDHRDSRDHREHRDSRDHRDNPEDDEKGSKRPTKESGKKSNKSDNRSSKEKRSIKERTEGSEDKEDWPGKYSEDESVEPAEEPKKSGGGKKKPVAMMALGGPSLNDETSASSLEQILAIQSTEALLQQLAKKSRNFGIRTDEFEAITSPSDLSNLCGSPRTSIANRNRFEDKLKPRLREGKVVKRRSDPLSNVVVKEKRLIPEPSEKNNVHSFLGQSTGTGASAVQMRRRNMRVYCTSSIKREVRPSSAQRRFKETRV